MLGDCVITAEECPPTKMPEQSLNSVTESTSNTLTSPSQSKKLKQARLPFKILDAKLLPEFKPGQPVGKKRKTTDSGNFLKASKLPKNDDFTQSRLTTGSSRHDDAQNEVSSSSEADFATKSSDQKTGKPRGLDRFVQSTQQLEVSTSCIVIDIDNSNDNVEDEKSTDISSDLAKPHADLIVQDETGQTSGKTTLQVSHKILSNNVDTVAAKSDLMDNELTPIVRDGAAETITNASDEMENIVTSVSLNTSTDNDADDSNLKDPSTPSSLPVTPNSRATKRPLSAIKRNQKEEERRKKQEERDMAKEEKQRQKELEKQKKEEERKEKERLKEEQRLEKEKQKKEERDRKEQEKQQREKERQEKLAEKEKDKEEKLKIKEEERKKKQDAIDAKLGEKKRKEEEKDEEKKKKEEEKNKLDQLKNKKIQQSQSLFKNFFKKVEPTEPVMTTEKVGPFSAFHVLQNMKMAPRVRISIAPDRRDQLDQQLVQQSSTKLYIDLLHDGEAVPGISGKTWPYDDDLVILKNEPMKTTQRMQAKLLKFHENYRPAYYGTWRKLSKTISARHPFRKDEVFLDYDVDSDDEWEEEEPGESLSNSEGEADGEDNKEDDDENDGFFVPHGYLSDGEGCEKEEDEDVNPESMKMRQVIKARMFEADLKTRTEVLQMITVGCRWCQSGDKADSQLGPYSATFLGNSHPIMIKSDDFGNNTGTKVKKVKETKEGKKGLKPQHVPDEAMSHLIHLVHGNLASIKVLIREFRVFWSRNQNEKDGNGENVDCMKPESAKSDVDINTNIESTVEPSRDQGVENDPTTPMNTEPKIMYSMSKRQLDMKIREIATYHKSKNSVMCWNVNKDILDKYEMSDLPITNAWKWITPAPKIRTFVVKESPSAVTPTNHSIKQFAVPGLIHANTAEARDVTPAKLKILEVTPCKTKATTTSPSQQSSCKKGPKKFSTKPITLFCSKKGLGDRAVKPATVALSEPVPLPADDDDCMIVSEEFVPPPPSKSQPTLLSMFKVKDTA